MTKDAIKGSKSRTKVWPCGNCGHAHWGYYQAPGGLEDQWWEFNWTYRDGRDRPGTPC